MCGCYYAFTALNFANVFISIDCLGLIMLTEKKVFILLDRRVCDYK